MGWEGTVEFIVALRWFVLVEGVKGEGKRAEIVCEGEQPWL